MDEPQKGFYEEWDSIHYGLFRPIRDKGKPEYGLRIAVVTEPDDYQEIVAQHFLGSPRGQLSFAGSAFKFEQLMVWVVKHLTANGYCTLLCRWQQGPSIRGSAVWLPINPRLVDMGNVLLVKRPRMPPLTWLRSARGIHWRRAATDESISLLCLGHRPPAIAAWSCLREIRSYWESGMYRAQGSVEPDNREIAVERARFISERELWRHYVMAKFRVAHVFRTVPNSVLVSSQAVTQYYDGYIRYVHAREILALRGLVLQALNETLMKELTERNQGKVSAVFSLRAPTVDPDSLWHDYTAGKIGLLEFSKQLDSV